jgi:hypothetical protein
VAFFLIAPTFPFLLEILDFTMEDPVTSGLMATVDADQWVSYAEEFKMAPRAALDLTSQSAPVKCPPQ